MRATRDMTQVVGNFVGADALSAVGVCGPSGFLMVAICNGMTGGATRITTALVCLLRYRGGKWKKKSLVMQREAEVEAGKAASA